MRYIDGHIGERHDDADGQGLRWGVESICDQLTELGAKIAPATYNEHRSRNPSVREQRDKELKPKIAAVHAANYGVYGVRKVWLTLNRERPADAPPIARCTVDRAPAARAGRRWTGRSLPAGPPLPLTQLPQVVRHPARQ